jgi:hypothetical protein
LGSSFARDPRAGSRMTTSSLSFLRPFVLRCPSCSAPIDGEGRTKCKYCAVPLAWEPRESLGRDDHWMTSLRQEERGDTSDEDRGVAEIALGPEAVCAGEVRVFQLQPQLVFRPTHVWIHPGVAPHFSVASVRVGQGEVLQIMEGKLSGLRFSKGRGFPIESDTLTPGIIMSVTVENMSAVAWNFQGSVRGQKLIEPLQTSSYFRTAHPIDYAKQMNRQHRGYPHPQIAPLRGPSHVAPWVFDQAKGSWQKGS